MEGRGTGGAMVVTGVDRHPVREKKSGAECGSLSVALCMCKALRVCNDVSIIIGDSSIVRIYSMWKGWGVAHKRQ